MSGVVWRKEARKEGEVEQQKPDVVARTYKEEEAKHHQQQKKEEQKEDESLVL